MSTILGVETEAGVVLAADRRHVDDGTVRSEAVDRTLDFGYAAAVAVGTPGDVDAFGRDLRSDLERYRRERERDPTLETVARTAARIAEARNVEAIVAGRTEDSTAELRTVGNDGAVLADDTAAFGSGAAAALAALDGADLEGDLSTVADRIGDLLVDVAERDPGTGAGVDVLTLRSS